MHPKLQVTDFERPLTTVDLVIFSVRDDELTVLVVQRPSQPGEPFPGKWALPGGFIDTARDRDLEACARRKLVEKTGVEAPYLEQLHGSFGGATRDPTRLVGYACLLRTNGVGRHNTATRRKRAGIALVRRTRRGCQREPRVRSRRDTTCGSGASALKKWNTHRSRHSSCRGRGFTHATAEDLRG